MSKFVNTKNRQIILGAILIVVIIGGSYGAYSHFFSGAEPTPEHNEPEPVTVTVVDVSDTEVTITKPVNRIVAMIGAEFISALGCQDKIVGRVKLTTDEEAILPQPVVDLPIVGDTDSTANLELILELEPDLVIASQRLSDENRAALEAAGVAVIEESSTYPRRETYLQNLGLILDAQDEANNFLEFEAYYEDLIKDRVANLTDAEKPTVYFEWYKDWYSSGANGSYTEMIITAGAINIAGDQPVSSMDVSAEFVAESNPDMIVRMLTFYDGETLDDFQALHEGLMNRVGLEDTIAVQNEDVYIIKNTALVGRRPIGLLYLAKWFHPTLFEDINPAVIHQEYVQTFFGASVSGVFVYPEEIVEPTEPTEPSVPETLLIVDAKGNQVELTLPVETIVCMNPGLTELLCALGGDDRIVGRDENSLFPESILDATVVGGTSYTPNLEMILELNPDLLIADTMLSYKTEELETIRNAGIPVIMESSSNFTRLPEMVTYFGNILQNSENAESIIDFMEQYENLVIDRTETLEESEKPKVYIEWNNEWLSFAEGSSSHDILLKAGGINIASGNSDDSSPTLSPEFVTEQDPDVIIRMASSGSNFTGIQSLRAELLSRSGLSGTTAVSEDRVYIYGSVVFQGLRYPIGLLYWAKWFNPSLFADIDPGAIHEEMIQQFFGEDIDDVYAYPEIVTVVDGNDTEMTLNLPVERVVSINSGLTEILSALGCENIIVGRDKSSTLPPSVLDIPVVADNSYMPNVELILELEPDVLFADAMLPYNTELYDQLLAAGLTVFIADPSDPEPSAESNETVIDFTCKLVSTIAKIVGEEETANEYIDYVQYYNVLVQERLENLTEAEMPKVLLEWYQPYQTFVTPGLDQAGGINIAENQTEYAPTLSAEFVVEQNPDIIIRAISSTEHDEADFIAMRAEIFSRPELSGVTAIENEQVYIYDFVARGGIRCVIGYLYWAKWCQPTLFEDIDPATVIDELNQQFFGTDIPGVYAYP
ncbi:MAG: ABC transporter substrate-binding protein [Candidatus Bathyarchaeota archaeon]|nr:ABC transporter substrate-binding protein [Candidatus Bathyarchaeum tardum]